MGGRDKILGAGRRVAIYARYSSDSQNPSSIEDQISGCRRVAASHGWEVVEERSDAAISGSSFLARQGMQEVLDLARRRRFDILMAEGLDRISRSQADTASIFDRLQFANISIFTAHEGLIDEFSAGVRGAMNQALLTKIAESTRRGMRGKAEAGQNAGGNRLGYNIVRELAPNGEVIRGNQTINPAEARLVERIFNEYASGNSPAEIARRLNAEGTPSPGGGHWNPSTIHGNAKRGTGILNNELYIGQRVWNRLEYRKDPETRRRVSRPRDPSEVIRFAAPELRIVSDELWEKVKARQCELALGPQGNTPKAFYEQRRPKYLLSGLVRCGVCGGSASTVGKNLLGCYGAWKQGVCSNKVSLRCDALEMRVMTGLETRIMTDEAIDRFGAAYISTVNTARLDRMSRHAALKTELQQVDGEHRRLVEALGAGVPVDKVKDRMVELHLREMELKELLADVPEAINKPLLHPTMARRYRESLVAFRTEYLSGANIPQAFEAVRSMIDKIDLNPEVDPITGKLVLVPTLVGDLAGILQIAEKPEVREHVLGEVKRWGFQPFRPRRPLNLSQNANSAPSGGAVHERQLKVVAGAGFEPATLRL
jgi:site-specific DNA recombinase